MYAFKVRIKIEKEIGRELAPDLFNKAWDEEREKIKEPEEKAIERFIEWYKVGNEYSVDIFNPIDLMSFMSDHRFGCVYMVILSKFDRNIKNETNR